LGNQDTSFDESGIKNSVACGFCHWSEVSCWVLQKVGSLWCLERIGRSSCRTNTRIVCDPCGYEGP
jgi:hypothetical protein